MVVLGAKASGLDISIELAKAGAQVMRRNKHQTDELFLVSDSAVRPAGDSESRLPSLRVSSSSWDSAVQLAGGGRGRRPRSLPGELIHHFIPTCLHPEHKLLPLKVSNFILVKENQKSSASCSVSLVSFNLLIC